MTTLQDEITEPVAMKSAVFEVPRCRHAASTTQGNRRSNEDCWGAADNRFVVADGVAHGLGGDFASAQAVAGFLTIRVDERGWQGALRQLDRLVAARTVARGLLRAATTLVGIEVLEQRAVVAHAGDSRAYLLRNDILQCLTVDHSLATKRRSEGRDPADMSDGLGKPRALTSYLGTALPLVQVTDISLPVMNRDRLLLCTDGVHEQLSFGRIEELVRLPDPQTVVNSLTAAADAAGARDNSTALLVEVGL